MPRILFVCTGNTCRSPMAEHLLRELLKKAAEGEDWDVSSAGLAALPGEGPSTEAVRVMEEKGIDLRGHSSRAADKKILQEADLILTMTRRHRERLKELIPEKAHRIFTLKEFSRGSDLAEGEANISDPFGQAEEIYRQTRDEIERELDHILSDFEHFINVTENLAGKKGISENNNLRGDIKLKIAIGSDHAGYELKEDIINFLQEEGFEYQDLGTGSTDSVDYPDFAFRVASAVISGDVDRGILICGTGIGMSISANKIKGIRAALCHDVFSARATRNDNNSNVLTMGARVVGAGLAREIVRTWLGAEFLGGRHEKRVNKINLIERGEYSSNE